MQASISRRGSSLVVATATCLLLSVVPATTARGAETDQPPGPAATAPAGSGPDGTSPPASEAVPSDWALAPSLVGLRQEIDGRWPDRDRSSDGALGDARHREQLSSHNPVGTPNGPSHGTAGSVHALDITAQGVDVPAVLDAVVGDSRIWYVIHAGRIWSRTTGWTPRMHRGDPHSTHLHINLREDSQGDAVAAENDTSPWFKSGGRGASAPTRGKRRGSEPDQDLTKEETRRLQQALIDHGFPIASGATGWYGPETTDAVRAYQISQGWTGEDADGIAGKKTLRRLGVRSRAAKAPEGGKPSAEQPAPSAAATEATSKPAEKPAAEKKADEQAAKAKSATKKPATKKTAEEKAAAKKAGTTKTKDKKPATKKPATTKPKGKKAGTKKPATKKPGTKKPATKKPGTKKPATKKPGTKKPATKKPTTTKPTTTKPKAKKPATKKPATTKPKGKKAGTKKRATKKPATGKGGGDWMPNRQTVPTSSGYRTYKPWTAHRDIYFMQQALAQAGYPVAGGPTGYYGIETIRAVRSFQRSRGWTGKQATGAAGAATLRALGR